MTSRRWKNTVFWILTGGLLLPAYNNCSGGFSTANIDAAYLASLSSFSSLNLSGKCESQLLQVFKSSYHPFLQANCNGCHVPGGGGSGTFAVADAALAFNEFLAKGVNRISDNAIGSHKPPYTGSQHNATITSLRSTWDGGISAYNTCVAERDAIPGAGGGPGEVVIPVDQGTTPTADTVITSNKRGPAGYISNSPAVPVTSGAPNYTNYNGFRTLEWNLNTDVVSPSKQYAAFVQIDVAPYVAIENGVQVKRGFLFRNPRARLATAGSPAIRLQRLYVRLNNQLVTTLTTYSNVDAAITTTTASNFIAGVTYGLLATTNPPSDTDDISLHIQTVTSGAASGGGGGGTPSPTVPTFAQLTGNDPAYNVFSASCIGCHSSTNARAGVNLQDYNNARTNGPRIVAAMKNAGNPMPTNGLLPAARVKIVEDWVAGNYPQ